eukprot:252760-Pelagomonas_calceolata.AAC.1
MDDQGYMRMLSELIPGVLQARAFIPKSHARACSNPGHLLPRELLNSQCSLARYQDQGPILGLHHSSLHVHGRNSLWAASPPDPTLTWPPHLELLSFGFTMSCAGIEA